MSVLFFAGDQGAAAAASCAICWSLCVRLFKA
jgi:hypothetical protein